MKSAAPARRRLGGMVVAALTGLLAGSGVIYSQGAPAAAPVRFTEARQHLVRRSVVLSGSVESRRSSLVAAEVEGVVERLLAREGDRVDRGQPLVTLRRENLTLRLEAVRGQLKEAEARQSLARTSLERTRGLFAEKIISEQQLDDARSEFEAWQGRVDQLGAEVARLEDDLARTTVRAPFSGVVVEERIAEGEWLGEGGAVVQLVDQDDLEVMVEVPEGSFDGLQVGAPVRVVVTSLGNLEVEGTVRAVVPRADSRARTFPVRVAIGNPEGRIAVGMLAQVHLPVGKAVESVIIPKDAIVEQGDQKVVYRIGADNKVERLSVQVGSPTGVWVSVVGDLSAGDRVVTRGNERVFPGQAVEGEALEYQLP